MSRLPVLVLFAAALLWPSCSPVTTPDSRTIELFIEGIARDHGILCSTAVESVRVEVSKPGFATTVTRPVRDLGDVSVPLTVPGGTYDLTAELVSNEAPLYRGTTRFYVGQDDFRGTVAVVPIDGVPMFCPADVALVPGYTTTLLVNRGPRSFSWSLDGLQVGGLSTCVSVSPTQGTVGPGDSTAITFNQVRAIYARAPIVVDTNVGRLPATVSCRGDQGCGDPCLSVSSAETILGCEATELLVPATVTNCGSRLVRDVVIRLEAGGAVLDSLLLGSLRAGEGKSVSFRLGPCYSKPESVVFEASGMADSCLVTAYFSAPCDCVDPSVLVEGVEDYPPTTPGTGLAGIGIQNPHPYPVDVLVNCRLAGDSQSQQQYVPRLIGYRAIYFYFPCSKANSQAACSILSRVSALTSCTYAEDDSIPLVCR